MDARSLIPGDERMTDVEIEEKWGETHAGDALGYSLKSLADFGEERAISN